MKKVLPGTILLVFVLSACSIGIFGDSTQRTYRSPMGGGWVWDNDNYSSNGEWIYFTGTTEEGEWIPYSGGPSFGGMMGGQLTCASCHGSDGRGGTHVMHMEVMDAPDIRFSALIEELDEHEHESPETTDGHAQEHDEYNLDDFRRAVVLGEHPDGDPLDHGMPRWQLGEGDLKDLFEFLKSLD